MGMSIYKERLALCKGKIKKCFNAIQDFLALFRLMEDRLPQFDVECWAVMSWAIWNARNKFYYEKFQAHPRSILNGALGFLDEYQSSEACGWTPKLLILFVTFVCSGCTCTMFPPYCFLQFLPTAIAIVFPLFGFMLRGFTLYTFSYQYNFNLLPKKKLGESIIVFFLFI